MAYEAKTDDGFFGGLRATDAASGPVSPIAAGPFDVAPACDRGGALPLSDALITGLLVVYPVLATVVALVVGLSLSGPVV